SVECSPRTPCSPVAYNPDPPTHHGGIDRPVSRPVPAESAEPSTERAGSLQWAALSVGAPCDEQDDAVDDRPQRAHPQGEDDAHELKHGQTCLAGVEPAGSEGQHELQD